MLSNVASTVSHVVTLGRPEVAAACSFAAMVGGNMADVRDITCKMIDQVSWALTFVSEIECQVKLSNAPCMPRVCYAVQAAHSPIFP